MSPDKFCFVIAPIGEPESETRRRSDQILKHLITPVIASLGFKAVRSDQIAEPGMITSQVIQRLVDDPLVVADLTERNPNVFYELAIRHAVRKPLVQLIRRGEQLPFDVYGMRTISVDHHDLDNVEAAKREMLQQIAAALKPGAIIETPVQAAIKLQALQQSDDPQKQMLVNIFHEVSALRGILTKLEATSSPPPKALPDVSLNTDASRRIAKSNPFAQEEYTVRIWRGKDWPNERIDEVVKELERRIGELAEIVRAGSDDSSVLIGIRTETSNANAVLRGVDATMDRLRIRARIEGRGE